MARLTTLKDIGEELSLSVATVSRALNGFPEVSLRTRQKVRETADRMGYRPNRVAQRLVTGRSGMVGMVLKIKPDMTADEMFFEILTRLTAALSVRETDLVLAVDQGTDPVAPYERMIERNILDGFILNAPQTNDPRIAFLRQRGIPFVVHGRAAPDADYAFYEIDNQAVSADAVDLLVALGHKSIALINGTLRHAYAADRLTGFKTAMARHGLRPQATSEAVIESHGYTKALAMLAAGTPPTAFLCASTQVAAGVVRATADRGLRIPRDVSIVAHDDAHSQVRAVDFDPPLTVTRAPLRDACEPLAELLLDVLGGKPAPECQRLIKAELIVRGSTGPAPKEA